jgi:LacI family transcriptional regulator
MQQMNELGKKAVEILIQRIENPETPTQQVLMQASIIKRESSKKKKKVSA